MKALVVYESLFGNASAIADAVADGRWPHGEVRVVPVGEAAADLVAWAADLVAWADLLVAGAPRTSAACRA